MTLGCLQVTLAPCAVNQPHVHPRGAPCGHADLGMAVNLC